MKRQQPRQWRTFFALGLALSLVAASCGDDDGGDGGDEEAGRICSVADGGIEAASSEAAGEDEDAEAEGDEEEGQEAEDEDAGDEEATGSGEDDIEFEEFEGETVTVFGPEVEVEQQSLQDAFAPFEDQTGITVEVAGDRGFEEQIGAQIAGQNPPDIAMFPQPGKVHDFAEDVVTLPDDIVAAVEENFNPDDLVTLDGEILGVPAKADLKSLVWYSPATFEDNGYEVPETLDDFLALTCQMMDDGTVPFCIGLGSDAATGWPMTDWIEDFVLRLKGPDVYDQWYQHEIPFDDPDIVEATQFVVDLWSQDGFVLGGVENVAATPFADAGEPLLDDDCLMYRMSNFYGADFGAFGAEVGPDGDVDAFYLPGSTEHPNITLTGGIYAVALSDDPAVMETQKYIATTQFANSRAEQGVGGFLSPNQNVDSSLYPEDQQAFAEILSQADPPRFDASDLMPGAVGSGSFWTAAVDMTTGTGVEDALAGVESSWPEE